MKDAIKDELRESFTDPEYRRIYADSFLNTSIAAQIKALREERGLSQEGLATKADMAQGTISRLENVNYSSWTINTLRRLAEAFDLALVVKFASFGELLDDIAALNRENLTRPPFADDPAFQKEGPAEEEVSAGSSAPVVWLNKWVEQKATDDAERAASSSTKDLPEVSFSQETSRRHG